jgi:hypothetical protein
MPFMVIVPFVVPGAVYAETTPHTVVVPVKAGPPQYDA